MSEATHRPGLEEHANGTKSLLRMLFDTRTKDCPTHFKIFRSFVSPKNLSVISKRCHLNLQNNLLNNLKMDFDIEDILII